MRLRTADGLSLEAQWDGLDSGRAVCVLCHPHPLQQGTMNAPLMRKVTAHLVEGGFAVLRFNFRGVGDSEGSHGGGIAEVGDVAAAMEAARAVAGGRPTFVAGWSFGAATALRWQAETGDRSHYAGIAPAVGRGPGLPDATELKEARRGFVLGDRDQFVEVDDLREYADEIGATLTVLEGSDHFFYFREERVAEAVAEILAGH